MWYVVLWESEASPLSLSGVEQWDPVADIHWALIMEQAFCSEFLQQPHEVETIITIIAFTDE